MSVLNRRSLAPLRYRNRRGDHIDVESVSASDAKNEFGQVLRAAQEHGAVAITKHDAPEAVLLSVEEFCALTESHAPARLIDDLRSEFDAQLAAMQTPAARAGMRRAFNASPRELGEIALAAAQRRKQQKQRG